MADVTIGQLKVAEKLISDEDFRRAFFEDPEAALAQAGLELSEEETAALKKVNQKCIDHFLADLDERLSKSGAGVIISPPEVTSAVIASLRAK
jgi:putative modified peptide